jgi:hypothetical protein
MHDPRNDGRGLLHSPYASEVLEQVRSSPAVSDAANAAIVVVRRAALDALSRKSARTMAGRKSALLAALKHARAALDGLIQALGD